MTPVERACVVCGQGSTREDWIKVKKVNGATHVACDGHSDKEFSEAVARVTTLAPAKPAEKPQVAQTSGGSAAPQVGAEKTKAAS